MKAFQVEDSDGCSYQVRANSEKKALYFVKKELEQGFEVEDVDRLMEDARVIEEIDIENATIFGEDGKEMPLALALEGIDDGVFWCSEW